VEHRTIRATVPEDTEALVHLTSATGVFKPHEVETLREVLGDFFAGTAGPGHCCHTLLERDQVVGFEYHAPTPMTIGTWHLYWIAVDSPQQTRGRGARLLKACEEDIRAHGGRVLFIETSALPHYERTRQFYLKHGYDKEAVLRDYYAPGDDMVVFRKSLA
jgi:ribosomal protein S18 acetylase RimI-like enzyme